MKNKFFGDVSRLSGHIDIEVRDKDGKVKKLFNQNFLGRFLLKNFGIDLKMFLFGSYANALSIHNLITTAGKGEATNLLGNVSSPAYFTYLAVGTGTTAAAAGDTALESETTGSGLARASATVTRQTTTTTNDTLQLYKQWTASGSVAVTECGIFNNASAGSGVLLGRQVFSAVNVVSGDTIAVTYKVALS